MTSGKDFMDKQEIERFKDKPAYYSYGFGPYNAVIDTVKNTCLKCDRKFEVKVREYDDARFVRHCQTCKQTIRNGDFDLDFTEKLGF